MTKEKAFIVILSVLCVIVTIIWANPVPVSIEDVEDSVLYNDFSEDDIIEDLLRAGKIAPIKKWPKGVVYYKISKDFDPEQVANITTAMGAIESVSCVRFRKAKPNPRFTPAYVDIKGTGIGCKSAIGYQGRAQRFILQSTVEKCLRVPIIMHELMHALGFHHEHVSPDRDDYIRIFWENIQPGREQWFQKLDREQFSDFGIGYDYDSIMHYGRYTFGMNDSMTLQPLDPNARVGQRRGLSLKDIAKINAMYNCPIRGIDDTDSRLDIESYDDDFEGEDNDAEAEEGKLAGGV